MCRMVYIYSELPSYVRVKKNLGIFSAHCEKVLYIGANRNGQSVDISGFPSNVRFKIFDKKIRHGGLMSLFGTLRFAIFVMRQIRKEPVDIVVFANEELAWIRFFLGGDVRVVCEVLDSLAIRTTGLTSRLSFLLDRYCQIIYRNCDAVVEVSVYRANYRRYRHPRLEVIPNAPIVDRLRGPLISAKLPEGLKYVYVSGSVLPIISGVEKLMEAVELAKLPDLKIVYSGRLDGRWAKETLFRKNYVINLGCLGPEESLSVAAGSLAMFAFYKPVNMNYVLASPNKIADAVYLGKRIIVNRECHAADYIATTGLALVCSFDDSNELAATLTQLWRGQLPPLNQETIGQFYEENFSAGVIEDKWQRVLFGDHR